VDGVEVSALPAILSAPARLSALRATALLDSPQEEAFDRLTRLASHALNVPVALVSLVDEDRQFFKSCIGLPDPWGSQRGTPLSHSFCQHAVASGEPLVIEDARKHPLVRDNLAIRDLDVIAYAGVPLVTSDGAVLGTFCAIDSKPRRWTDDDVEFVREMAASAMTEIELRSAVRQLEDARAEAEGTAMTLRELQAISDAALVNLEIDDLLRELLSRVTSAVDADLAAILLDDGIRASRGLEPGEEQVLVEFGRTLESEPGATPALVGVPLVVGAQQLGLLAVGTRVPARRFTDDESKLLELAAERAAHGIYNARLYEQAQSDAELLEEQLVATLKRQQAEAVNAATERGRLLSHIVGAQEEERRRIALDVHDDYLQSLTAVRMQLERLAGGLEAPDQREVAEQLVRDVLATTERMRSLVFHLRPPALDWAGVASALRLYLEETHERFGLAYELDNRLDEEPSGAVRLDVYRIAQEAITNVRKHAEASHVEVSLASRDHGVLVTIRDDGHGVDAAPDARSFGLASMRERAESAGGWWRIDTRPQTGTTVEFWVPASAA
jgi:signal transduction histidine kinase